MRGLFRSGFAVLITAQMLFVGAGSALAFHDPPPDRVTQVRDSVVAGRAYLLGQQDATSGCWDSDQTSQNVGVTALAMLAIIHSEPGGYAAQSATTKAALAKGTACLVAHAQTDGTIRGCSTCGNDTYNTSIAIWALSEVPVAPAVTAAITGGRNWLLDNQRNGNDQAGRADAGGNQNNGGWFYEGGKTASFVEHSNSSFALQGLEASGGIPAATANLAQGFFTCLQRRGATLCGDGGGSADGGFIYSHQLNKGGTQTSATGSGSFALSLTGVAGSDARIKAAIAYLDASLVFNACSNNSHSGTDLTQGWSADNTLIHYAAWANLKAHELAGVADDLSNTSNWYYKIANCLTSAQQVEGTGAGSFPASSREDTVLSTSFALLTLEKVTPEKQIEASGKTITATVGQGFSGAVASFTDADTKSTAAEYTASIDWGDGSKSAGTISGSTGGPFAVNGTHTYAAVGSFTVKVAITDADNSANTATATTPATVNPVQLPLSGGGPAGTPASDLVLLILGLLGLAGVAGFAVWRRRLA